ncbi:MAG: condensation domain-containing protein [Nitrospirales bacterium]
MRRSGLYGTPLAFVQEPLWLATQLDPANTSYNRSLVLALEGPLNSQALERPLNEIVRRHETLRTTFQLGANGPRQTIAREGIQNLKYCDLSHIQKSEMEETFITSVIREVATPFDLVHGPVYRATLFRLSRSEHRLVVILRHLKSDGRSDGVFYFYKELEALYNRFCRGESLPLPELSIQYGDFVLWQRQWLTGETLESQLAYWKNRLKGLQTFQVFPETKTPSGRTRQSGKREKVLFSPLQTNFMKTFSRQEGVTSFMVLLAGFFILLHQWTQKIDLICGVPLANRMHPLLEPLIGLFVNTLPFRSTIQEEYTFRTYIQYVHSLNLETISHADVPIQELRQRLRHTRDLIGTFLFQVLFVFENAP